MRILLVNDDGISSRGLREIADALSREHEIWVSAPDRQNSGKSQAITIGGNATIEIERTEYPGAKGAMSTTGTPADAAKVGIQFFGKEGVSFDLLVSGINVGSNLGQDTLYSGTVGAALEGGLSGIPSIAVSVDSFGIRHYDGACRIVLDLIPFAVSRLTPDTILNVNVPDCPYEDIRGIRVTSLGGRYYYDSFQPQPNGGYALEGIPTTKRDEEKKLDITALLEGYASVTPLTFDFTRYDKIGELKSWDLAIRREDGRDAPKPAPDLSRSFFEKKAPNGEK